MSSPPAGHPFLRPAVAPSAQQVLSTPQPGGTTYYRPQDSSDTGHGSLSMKSSSRPESRASTQPRPRSSQITPTVRAMSPPNAKPANGHANPAEDAPPRKMSRWEEKVQGDLVGWRGGEGKPYSTVPQAGVASETYYGQPRTGTIGQDLPKEIVRIERDWSLGDICKFSTTFPLELESRVTPKAFTAFIESLNEPLVEAYSVSGAVVDNLIAVATWWTSLFWRTSHFEKELRNAEKIIQTANEHTFNPVGLNVLSPRFVALQYLEIEYY